MDSTTTSMMYPNGASKFLLDLPSKGLFSSPTISSNMDGMRVYVTHHDTSPPANQLIKTEQTSMLIRSKSAGTNENSRMKGRERAAGRRASAKRASSTTQNEGLKSKLPENLQNFTVEKLRTFLKERGLSVTGKKVELIGWLKSASSSSNTSAANTL